MNTNRVVTITGAAGGIGALLVERFLANGDTVFATDVSTEALSRLDALPGAEHLITAAADISSVFDGTPGQAHYVAAKAGVAGFSRSLAREVGSDGITVNVITPGLTVTKAVRDSFPPEVLAAQRDGRALPRDETPEDLVGPVFFLASPDADFISGQTLNVDGGKYLL